VHTRATSIPLTIDPSVAGVAFTARFPLGLPAAPAETLETLPKTGFDVASVLRWRWRSWRLVR
jgi:hypothetical protein